MLIKKWIHLEHLDHVMFLENPQLIKTFLNFIIALL